MDIFKLYNELPHGFHDALLCGISTDYVKRTAELRLDLLIDLEPPESGRSGRRMIFRQGVLRLTGLSYCVIDPPDPTYPYQDSELELIDIDEIDPETAPNLPTNTPPENFRFRLYNGSWNSFVYISAADATWTDDVLGTIG